ncbi:MAG: hypothetical protein KKB62_01785 [Nanoarchaeota archaeon]|nr:hypothetical protein [Nanoarchaeota archaeon]
MGQRREAIDLAKEIYFFMKKDKKEYSINRMCKIMKAKYEIVITCLEFLKSVGLIKERKGDKKPIPGRLFSLK